MLCLLAAALAQEAADEEILVTDEVDHPTADRGTGDVRVVVADVQAVQTTSAADALELAPSVFLTRTGGDVHPAQIFLRGFDARHGQDVEVSVDGMPLNQVGNPHGHGLVDLGFIPPEALLSLRVIEGPFDPTQGDFAVAGSIRPTLGLGEPGLLFRGQIGSFGTARSVVGWQSSEEAGTFAVAEVFRTAGYGENRGAQKGSALVRAEGGDDTRWSLLGGAYASSYELAGLVRRVDVDDGAIDLYGTQDDRQGGSFQQGFVAGTVSGDEGDTDWRLRFSGARRSQRLRSNLTGFLTDDRRAGESQHDQRGDLTDQGFAATTLALDADVQQSFYDLPSGMTGALLVGAYGRYDDVEAHTWRVRALDDAPYRVEADYRLRQGNAAVVADTELSGGIAVARVGGRLDTFVYDLLDRCGAKDEWHPDATVDDVNCPADSRNGPRLRSESRTAQGLAASPRATLLLRPTSEHTVSLSGGRGVRSYEALALSDSEDAPFASLWGGELGYAWARSAETWFGLHSLSAWTTRVDRDLLFDEEAVRNVVAGETTRIGGTAVSELHIGPLTERTTATYTYAVFGDDLAPSFSRYNSDRVPGALVPYVPPWVVRSDLSVAGPVGRALSELRGGLAIDAIAPRPLPQSERSDWVFTLDAMVSARVRAVQASVAVTNVLNRQYPLAEYNFASWFPDTSGQQWPTRIASRQVSPGAPRAVLGTVTLRPAPGGR
ncbi:MAG: iron complex outermembrane receptor protein [Myxococcota bacterium]|jgi:iron complex outermembrane receptor protein